MINFSPGRRRATLTLLVIALVGVIVIVWAYRSTDGLYSGSPRHEITNRSFAQRTGSYFSPPPVNPLQAPDVTEIPIPGFPTGNAIWGATGRDDRGHIWFGVSERSGTHSARLYEYIPETGETINRGDVIAELNRLGLQQEEGKRQSKIHSKIIQADDGFLYFSSMDEQGEKGDGSVLPTWGSHFWRILPGEHVWEHLFSAPEGLIAVSGVGRWIYALGYWDHVLYQYDSVTGLLRKKNVGSVDGHISRNFIADERGHVFVPKLLRARFGDNQDDPKGLLVTALVEFDRNLDELGATPLVHYANDEEPHDNLGILGSVYFADKSIIFVTHLGYLYRISPSLDGPSLVDGLGWFHPEGTAFTPALFTYEGKHLLVGIGRRKREFAWLVYDLSTNSSVAIPFAPNGGVFGSNTRDDRGRFYVAGRRRTEGPKRHMPVLLQLQIKQ